MRMMTSALTHQMCAINKGLGIVPGTSEVYVSGGVILTLSKFLLLLHIPDKMGISTICLWIDKEKSKSESNVCINFQLWWNDFTYL